MNRPASISLRNLHTCRSTIRRCSPLPVRALNTSHLRSRRASPYLSRIWMDCRLLPLSPKLQTTPRNDCVLIDAPLTLTDGLRPDCPFYPMTGIATVPSPRGPIPPMPRSARNGSCRINRMRGTLRCPATGRSRANGGPRPWPHLPSHDTIRPAAFGEERLTPATPCPTGRTGCSGRGFVPFWKGFSLFLGQSSETLAGGRDKT